jgi:hypothetical protein
MRTAIFPEIFKNSRREKRELLPEIFIMPLLISSILYDRKTQPNFLKANLSA